MPQVDLTFASHADRDDILDFISLHWRADHVFVSAPEVLDWQHQTEAADPGDLSFVLARDADTSGLIGVLGYISYRRFDPDLRRPSVALALWKTIDSSVAGLGVRMLWFLEKTIQPAMISVIGLNETVEQLYEALGYRVGSMDQWMIFRAQDRDMFRLASGMPEASLVPLEADDTHHAVLHDARTLPVDDVSVLLDLTEDLHLPEKTLAYAKARFIDHPFYSYRFLCVYEKKALVAVLVGRMVAHQGTEAFRVVDFFGPTPVLARGAAAVQSLLDRHALEYLELLFLCDSAEHLRSAGFIRSSDHPEMTVPAYFEPFDPRTVSIAYAFKCLDSADVRKVRLCRADSDQDRPNLKPSGFSV